MVARDTTALFLGPFFSFVEQPFLSLLWLRRYSAALFLLFVILLPFSRAKMQTSPIEETLEMAALVAW